MARRFRGPEKMLLCIDDSQAILQFEKSLFEKSGYIVITASSAREGLRLARIFMFDEVLLDYQMPDMNGHEVALALRRLTPGTPVVMFSGGEIPDETYKLVDAVIPKSGSIRELLPTVARLCDFRSPN
jgi:CheY-like chemotaxis protein